MRFRTYSPLAFELVRQAVRVGENGREPVLATREEEGRRLRAPAVTAVREVLPRGPSGGTELKLVHNDGRGPQPHAATGSLARSGSRPSLCIVGGMDHASTSSG